VQSLCLPLARGRCCTGSSLPSHQLGGSGPQPAPRLGGRVGDQERACLGASSSPRQL